MAMLHSTEESRISSAPVSTAVRPGRRITRAPRKPTKIAVQRRQRNTSPRNNALNSAVNSGAVKASAVARAIGVIDRPTKKHTIDTALINARHRCSESLCV